MKIKAIRKIENYRNLSSQSIQFDENVNFIIGENEIGKTNILELISRFFIEKHFLESDYYDLSIPVKITFELEDHTLLKGIQYPHSSLQINHEYKINGLFLKDIHPKDEQSYIQSIFKQIHTVKDSISFLLLDEPENHLQPYKQRTLIKKIVELTSCQLFIVTHSPNILLMNYKQFIRVFRNDTCLSIVSGSTISLENTELIKHMLHNFIYLKEAMFSHLVLFVEGDSEYGALPVFAQRMNIDLDEYGIGIVKLDGAESVCRCMNLYQKFGIPSLAIIDRDKEEKYRNVQSITFTEGIDFEEDLYNSFEFEDYVSFIKTMKHDSSFLKNYHNENKKSYMLEQKKNQLKYLREKKNAYKGFLLAKYVTKIPDSYIQLIYKAIKVTSKFKSCKI